MVKELESWHLHGVNTYFLWDFLFHQQPYFPRFSWWENMAVHPIDRVRLGLFLHPTRLSLVVTMAWQMEQKIPQCFRLIGGTKSLSKNRCSPHENAKIPTLLPRVAIFNLTKLSLMVTWYLIMDNRVEMAPIILWFWLKSNFSPTTGGDYNECNIISWTFDQTATCILVTWLVYIESELQWIVNAPLSPDQRDHRAGSQLKNYITCANHAGHISEIRVDKNVNDFFWTEATTETDQMES